MVSWMHSTSVPVLSSQARRRGSRAVIELTFQVAMRMEASLLAGCDSARIQSSAEAPGARREWSVPPSAPICRS
ncbi:hypothetical protein SGA01_35910 [Streptomyces gardneri]|uniref:Uncharacterized protein n=1 Tax=Streptomyces gardneri TaxID=66892 RepID=A0A4Y3RJT5_9ACTN|nr:hypothetical protein SGA01_35910 [Streptomyces gardneri]